MVETRGFSCLSTLLVFAHVNRHQSWKLATYVSQTLHVCLSNKQDTYKAYIATALVGLYLRRASRLWDLMQEPLRAEICILTLNSAELHPYETL